MTPIKFIITITQDPANEDFNRVNCALESENEVLYQTLINALIAVLDNLVIEQKKEYEKSNLQLEQFKTGQAEITGLPIDNGTGPESYHPSDNGPVF